MNSNDGPKPTNSPTNSATNAPTNNDTDGPLNSPINNPTNNLNGVNSVITELPVCDSIVYKSTLVKGIEDGVGVALSPQGVYVLTQEHSSLTATLKRFDDVSGKLLEETSLNAGCRSLFDLEWQDGELYLLADVHPVCGKSNVSDTELLRIVDGVLVKVVTFSQYVWGIASSAEDGQLYVLTNNGMMGRLDPKKDKTLHLDSKLPKGSLDAVRGFAYLNGHFIFTGFQSPGYGEVGNGNDEIEVATEDDRCKTSTEYIFPDVYDGVEITGDGSRLFLLGDNLELFTWSPL